MVARASPHLVGCHSALRVADELLGGDAPDARSPFFSSAGKFYGLAGHLRSARAVAAMVDGNLDDAEEVFTSIIERPAGPRQRVIDLAHLGDTHRAAGEPEATCDALHAALHDCQDAAYAMGVEWARGVRARFPERWAGLPCVADFDERLTLAAP